MRKSGHPPQHIKTTKETQQQSINQSITTDKMIRKILNTLAVIGASLFLILIMSMIVFIVSCIMVIMSFFM